MTSRAELPPFVLEDFFVGSLSGSGYVLSRSGALKSRFVIDARGEIIAPGTLALLESYVFEDGTTDNLAWSIRRVGPDHYEGREPQVKGIARGTSSKNTFRWRYKRKLRSASDWTLDLDDWFSGSEDMLPEVELEFPTLKSAIRYAERQGLTYVVQRQAEQRAEETPAAAKRAAHAFSDATLDRLGLGDLQQSYGLALDGAANRNDPSGPESWASPMAVVRDPTLTLEAKRSILMNWAWTEYHLEQAAYARTPGKERLALLNAIDEALLALERGIAFRRSAI